uniref:DNA damage-regulated autophagy modulator protein 2 n=1 Tax=Plectus sambesii TaxID=2011161 RepID=A0A914W9P0_9BILA
MSAQPPRSVRLFLLPVISFMFIPMGFFITYAISVLNKSVSPLFPMISETGTTEPGNYVFGAIVHFGTLLYLSTGIYAFTIRRMLINKARKLIPWRRTTARWANRVMLIPLAISSLGGFMIAHIELNQNPTWHFIGALTCFGAAMAYMILATILTLVMPLIRWLSATRVAICVTTALCFVGFLTHLFLIVKHGIHQQQGPDSIFIARFHINPNQNENNWTVIKALAMGSFCEWLMAFCYGFYMLTFAVEFGKITVPLPVPEIDENQDDEKDLEMPTNLPGAPRTYTSGRNGRV